jgi:hypothetical protein
MPRHFVLDPKGSERFLMLCESVPLGSALEFREQGSFIRKEQNLLA